MKPGNFLILALCIAGSGTFRTAAGPNVFFIAADVGGEVEYVRVQVEAHANAAGE